MPNARQLKGRRSPYGRPFRERLMRGRLPVRVSDNIGVAFETHFRMKRLHFRLGKGLADPSKWKRIGGTSTAMFFRTPTGMEIVVKPELEIFPKIGKLGRNKYGFRHMLPVLMELMRRRVAIERPLALVETQSGHHFYVVRREKGKTLASTHPTISIAESMGRFLAGIHSKGVVHGHPHNLNWVVEGGRARLIDSKAVSFKEDYPHAFRRSKRVLTWNEMTQNDVHVSASYLDGAAKDAFLSTYVAALAKKK
ncbi:MAG: hypothetical protein IPJ89_05340 [Candidatus Iainarchaeum archaeon]|uniref:Uncharacterized protein n=1 Tax=Candidatus Iainarchaeum sp. TaxID=3101447 RepID=A0A7T9I1L4_9ARCH|nr:MAG: hypothetical protein IPJ89_05340 [Candidatus Diapherotrites archaeon]